MRVCARYSARAGTLLLAGCIAQPSRRSSFLRFRRERKYALWLRTIRPLRALPVRDGGIPSVTLLEAADWLVCSGSIVAAADNSLPHPGPATREQAHRHSFAGRDPGNDFQGRLPHGKDGDEQAAAVLRNSLLCGAVAWGILPELRSAAGDQRSAFFQLEKLHGHVCDFCTSRERDQRCKADQNSH